MAVSQNAFEPWGLHCSECDLRWLPTPAKGQEAVTLNRLESETRRHWQVCPQHDRRPRRENEP